MDALSRQCVRNARIVMQPVALVLAGCTLPAKLYASVFSDCLHSLCAQDSHAVHVCYVCAHLYQHTAILIACLTRACVT
jgi:hypothetical protein